MSQLPHGADCYRALVRSFTTVDLEPKALHEFGLRQMAAIEARDAADRAAELRHHRPPRPDGPASDRSQVPVTDREEIIRTAEQAVARAKAAMPKWFGRLPKEDLIVDPCQPFEEKSGCPNSYLSGTPDGTRPGRWRINAADRRSRARPLEATAFHETIPATTCRARSRRSGRARIRSPATSASRGFWEGWALYAERLAMEMGLYSSDLDRLGELGSRRSARRAWSWTRACTCWAGRGSRRSTTCSRTSRDSRQSLESEVDRYIAGPAQATAYMVGRLEIERLRAEAEERLGPLRHPRVPRSGARERQRAARLLRSHVEAWVDSLAEPSTP